MASVNFFYCVKLCDEPGCYDNHINKIYKIEDHIKSCFKAHIVRDKLFNYVFSHNASVFEATHMQYLDAEGFIHIVSLDAKRPLSSSKVINFRLLTLSKWYYLTSTPKPYELDRGAKAFLKSYTNHLIK